MKKFLLTVGLAFSALQFAHAQFKYAAHVPTKPKAREITTDPAAKPTYAGVYVGGKQVTEINCFGFDSYDVVVPNFPVFESADRVVFLVGVYSFDKDGKSLTDRPDYQDYLEFSGARLQALLEKARGKGYIIFSKTDLLAAFNKNRELTGGGASVDNQIIFAPSSSLNCAKYTKMDPAKVSESALVLDVMTAQITGYNTTESGSTYPVYRPTVIYQAPKVVLNRTYTKTMQLKSKAVFGKELPEMASENCTTNKGADVSLTTIKGVLAEGYGEEIEVN